jgi:hypothetical protein
MVLVLLMTCALGSQPIRVAAQAPEGDAESERFDSGKFWDYVMCGTSLVFASSTGTWVIVFVTCGKALTEHWTN